MATRLPSLGGVCCHAWPGFLGSYPAALLVLSVVLTGCSDEGAPPASVEADATAASAVAESAVDEVGRESSDAPVNEGGLAGTAWRLVRIQYMNDTEDLPESSERYTLEFVDSENVAIGADCNRGRGTWTSESGSQLRFGPIATTRALCPPTSIGERYLSQFEWVRSYVRRGDRLYLATMADGRSSSLHLCRGKFPGLIAAGFQAGW